MGLNNITFILGQGGLGRPLPGEDHYSGMAFFTASLPSGFSSTERVKLVTSLEDAEALGIKNDYSDGTSAAGEVEFTAAGTNGDTVTIAVVTPEGTITFGTYTKAASEADVTAVGEAVEAIINAESVTASDGGPGHGFVAVNTAGSVAITAPKKYGVYLNSGTKLVTTLSAGATLAATTTQFTGGAASIQAVWHYHISEFFRIQPKGYLYLGFFAVPGAYTFTTEVNTMQTYAAGKIRQIAFYKDAAAFATADIIALNTALNAQFTAHKPLVGIYAADITAITDLTTLANLTTLNSPLVLATIGQDGGAQGNFLYATYGKSITDMGATLGAIALAAVHESIAWVQKFNMSNGTELDVAAFANGKKVNDPTISDNLLGLIQDRGYHFLRTFVGVAGTYNNESRTAVAQTSDYAYVENSRTIQKAVRGVYTSVIPALAGPLTLNQDGTLSDVTIEYYKTLAETNLYQMVRDGELSGTPDQPGFTVAIDAAQPVLSTGKLVIAISLLPVGVARNIEVKIGFNVNVTS